jgi:hypothetical protein
MPIRLREAVTADVMLNILNAYETFTPRFVKGRLLQLSLDSVRLYTPELCQADCQALLENRYVSKITLNSSLLVRPLSLKADVFWAKYVIMTEDENSYADLGFNLRRPDTKEDEILLSLLVNRLDIREGLK